MRVRRIPFGASELTQDADSGTWGAIIWLGTRSEKAAKRSAPALVPFPEEFGNIERSRLRKALERPARSGRRGDRAED